MKTAVIMGGNSGMGKATAAALAKKGYRVIIHGRDPKKTQDALAGLRKQTGNDHIEAIVGDMSTVAGTKKVAQAIQQKTGLIDVLVLSTGVIKAERVETADGMEMAFATQYLCRFALVQLLMPQLENAPEPRIVQVGAPTMKKAQIHFDDLSLKNNFSMMRSMGQAMLSDHLFVQEFARRNAGSKVVMNILHVGIAKTGIGREANFFLRLLIALVGKSPEAAAGNIIYLADHPDATFSGYFLKKPGHPEVKDKIRFDPALAEKLWNTSLKLMA